MSFCAAKFCVSRARGIFMSRELILLYSSAFPPAKNFCHGGHSHDFRLVSRHACDTIQLFQSCPKTFHSQSAHPPGERALSVAALSQGRLTIFSHQNTTIKNRQQAFFFANPSFSRNDHEIHQPTPCGHHGSHLSDCSELVTLAKLVRQL